MIFVHLLCRKEKQKIYESFETFPWQVFTLLEAIDIFKSPSCRAANDDTWKIYCNFKRESLLKHQVVVYLCEPYVGIVVAKGTCYSNLCTLSSTAFYIFLHAHFFKRHAKEIAGKNGEPFLNDLLILPNVFFLSLCHLNCYMCTHNWEILQGKLVGMLSFRNAGKIFALSLSLKIYRLGSIVSLALLRN